MDAYSSTIDAETYKRAQQRANPGLSAWLAGYWALDPADHDPATYDKGREAAAYAYAYRRANPED